MNKDGFLNYAEYMKAMDSTTEERQQQSQAQQMGSLDTNELVNWKRYDYAHGGLSVQVFVL